MSLPVRWLVLVLAAISWCSGCTSSKPVVAANRVVAPPPPDILPIGAVVKPAVPTAEGSSQAVELTIVHVQEHFTKVTLNSLKLQLYAKVDDDWEEYSELLDVPAGDLGTMQTKLNQIGPFPKYTLPVTFKLLGGESQAPLLLHWDFDYEPKEFAPVVREITIRK